MSFVDESRQLKFLRRGKSNFATLSFGGALLVEVLVVLVQPAGGVAALVPRGQLVKTRGGQLASALAQRVTNRFPGLGPPTALLQS